MTDTEPLDLDAVYKRWTDWYNESPQGGDWRLRDPGESMSHAIVREDVPDLMAEVRRLREAVETEHWGHMAAVALLEDAEVEVKRLRTQYLAIREAGQ